MGGWYWGVWVSGVGLGSKDPLKYVMVGSVEILFGFLGKAFVEIGAEGDRVILEVV